MVPSIAPPLLWGANHKAAAITECPSTSAASQVYHLHMLQKLQCLPSDLWHQTPWHPQATLNCLLFLNLNFTLSQWYPNLLHQQQNLQHLRPGLSQEPHSSKSDSNISTQHTEVNSISKGDISSRNLLIPSEERLLMARVSDRWERKRPQRWGRSTACSKAAKAKILTATMKM